VLNNQRVNPMINHIESDRYISSRLFDDLELKQISMPRNFFWDEENTEDDQHLLNVRKDRRMAAIAATVSSEVANQISDKIPVF